MSSSIARRYATALVESASAAGHLDSAVKDVESLAEALTAHADLRAVLANPGFTAQERTGMLKALVTRLELSPSTTRFLDLVAERHRFDLLIDIGREVRRLADEKAQRLRAQVDTAAPLTPDAEAALKKALEQRTGKSVELVINVDPTLLGGLRAKVGSVILDGTIRSQLSALRETLLRAQ